MKEVAVDHTGSGQHEARIQAALLGPEDTWLPTLLNTAEMPDDVWFQETNAILTVAATDLKLRSHHNRERAPEVQKARESFFLDRLDPGYHPSTYAAGLDRFIEAYSHHGKYPVPLNFIANCRAFAAHGVDLRTLRPAVLFEITPSNIPKLQALFADIEIDIPYLAKKADFLFTAEFRKIALHASFILRSAKVLGFGEQGAEMIRQLPRSVLASMPKLRLLGRIAAEHGDRESSERLKNPLVYGYALPLITHLLAIATHDVYEPRHAKTIAANIRPEERRERLLTLLDQGGEEKIGRRILQLYFGLEPLTEEERSRYPLVALTPDRRDALGDLVMCMSENLGITGIKEVVAAVPQLAAMNASELDRLIEAAYCMLDQGRHVTISWIRSQLVRGE